MATATPALEDVVDGVNTVLSAISQIGTVVKRYHTAEDDVEYVLTGNSGGSFISNGSLDLWLLDLMDTDPEEGPGTGEAYDVYNIRIRYWSLRTGNADWQKEARQKVQEAVNALTNHASVFAIGGQQQLHTPTTVRFTGPDQRVLTDRVQPEMVYEAVLTLKVEARRWE